MDSTGHATAESGPPDGTGAAAATKRRTELLTASRKKAFRACQRLHALTYEERYESVDQPLALAFGTALHAGLEAWWRSPVVEDMEGEAARAAAALEALAHAAGDLDGFERARAEELLVAYAARWGGEELEVLGVEVEYQAPLTNPLTGRSSRTFRQAGKLDALVRRPDGSVWVVEHKTSSEDISLGSEYWQRLRMDGQASDYYAAARSLGYDARGVIYDVLLKPAQKPLKATPPEKRQYRQDGRLYANQRDRDETVDEFRERVRAALLEDPVAYFARADVVRLEAEVEEHQADTWQTAEEIRRLRLTVLPAPRNPDACMRYGRACPFLPVCSGQAELTDTSRYQRRERQHPELSLELQTPKEEARP